MLKPFLLTAALIILLVPVADAQSYSLTPSLNAAKPTAWGPPTEVSVTSSQFKKRNLAPVALQVQVRFYKKVAQACNYEYLVTNASPTQAVTLKMYSMSDQKRTEKIGPGQTVLLPVETNLGGNKKTGNTPCAGYSPKLHIAEASPL